MFQIASLKCSSCNAEIVELLVTGANNLILLGLRRWFGVVDSSCWFVDVHISQQPENCENCNDPDLVQAL
jgi:hypothetical protein